VFLATSSVSSSANSLGYSRVRHKAAEGSLVTIVYPWRTASANRSMFRRACNFTRSMSPAVKVGIPDDS